MDDYNVASLDRLYVAAAPGRHRPTDRPTTHSEVCRHRLLRHTSFVITLHRSTPKYSHFRAGADDLVVRNDSAHIIIATLFTNSAPATCGFSRRAV